MATLTMTTFAPRSTEPVANIVRTVRTVGLYSIEEITLDGVGPFFQLRSTITGNLLFADHGPAAFTSLHLAEGYASREGR